MLQNAMVTAFIFSELLRENQQGEEVKLPTLPQIRASMCEKWVRIEAWCSIKFNLHKSISLRENISIFYF